MSCADIINSSGLFLDIVGVILLYKYGLPANVRKTGGRRKGISILQAKVSFGVGVPHSWIYIADYKQLQLADNKQFAELTRVNQNQKTILLIPRRTNRSSSDARKDDQGGGI